MKKWIVGALITLLLAFLAYKIYHLGYDARDLEIKADQVVALENAAKKTQEWKDKYDDAIKKRKENDIALQADIDNARHANDSMRKQLQADRVRMSKLSEQALLGYANTASDILAECTDKYQAMAETADRINADRQLLEDAWPTSR
jgi:hypothetical protein